MDIQRPLIEKVLDLVWYAPVGLVVELHSEVPKLVAGGRTRVRERVQVARWVGEMAVTYGRRELDKRLAAASAPGADSTTGADVPVTAPIRGAEASPPPFEGYEHLAAAQVVQLLTRLPHSELRLIRDYELDHRCRRTIVAKVDQLLAE